ncbi:hydrogenase expression/formation protein HypD [Bradyrhizobium diazoefficiens]
MKYADEFRDKEIALGLAKAIRAEADPRKPYRFMEFCGGHTHAISRYGLEDMLPANVRMIHGPGCPVCVLPAGRIDMAIRLAMRPDIILCVYGDLMRVPGSQGASLLKAKARGADIRMVYSTIDAIRIAEDNPGREVVFFAIGFETTTPPTAVMIRLAGKKQLENFSVFCNHVLTPPAMQNILESPDIRNIGRVEIDGFVGPAHVSTIIGTRALRVLCRGVRQACGDRGLRAARHDAGDPDAGAAGQRAQA